MKKGESILKEKENTIKTVNEQVELEKKKK
jgi:hypothetical protein